MAQPAWGGDTTLLEAAVRKNPGTGDISTDLMPEERPGEKP